MRPQPAAKLVIYDDLGPRPVLAVDRPAVEVDAAPEVELELDDDVDTVVPFSPDDEPSLERVRPAAVVPVPIAHREALDAWDADSTADTVVPRGRVAPLLMVLLGGSGLLVATALVLAFLVVGGLGLAVVASRSASDAVVTPPVVQPVVVAPVEAPAEVAPVPDPVAKAAPVAKSAPVAKAAPVAKSAPAVAAKPAVVPAVVPEAPVAADLGLTRVDVDGAMVVLLADGARYPLPARVPAGRYQVEATFDDGVPVVVDKLTVGADPVLVRCNPRMGICRGN